MAPKAALTDTGAALARLARDLEAVGARWALVGGLAVSARAEPRFTRDVDVAVQVASDEEAEELLWKLQQRGYAVGTVLEHEKLRRLATARLTWRGDGKEPTVLDILFASSGIEPAIVASAAPLEVLPGVRLPVARVGHLVAMKLLAQNDRSRPQDADDLRALLAVASPAELRRAREALREIQSLGAHRGKRLLVAMDRLMEEVAAGKERSRRRTASPARSTTLRTKAKRSGR